MIIPQDVRFRTIRVHWFITVIYLLWSNFMWAHVWNYFTYVTQLVWLVEMVKAKAINWLFIKWFSCLCSQYLHNFNFHSNSIFQCLMSILIYLHLQSNATHDVVLQYSHCIFIIDFIFDIGSPPIKFQMKSRIIERETKLTVEICENEMLHLLLHFRWFSIQLFDLLACKSQNIERTLCLCFSSPNKLYTVQSIFIELQFINYVANLNRKCATWKCKAHGLA